MQTGRQVKRQIVRFRSRLVTGPRFGGGIRTAAGLVWIICILSVDLCAAQDLPPPPIPVDPTPLVQLLSASERDQLSDASNHKKEVDFYLRVADTHLEMARSAIKNDDHRTSERELDIYNKAMSEAMKATAVRQERRGLAKKIEQYLYKQIKTLETIELLFPFERQDFATAALKQAKQLRVQALNAAFASGDTLKEPDQPAKPKTDSPVKDGSFRLKLPLQIDDIKFGYGARAVRAGYARGAKPVRFAQAASDYLTDEEDIKVREAQTADERAKVFMKIADRRIALLTGVAPAPLEKKPFWKRGGNKPEEEEQEWGVLKTTKRADLLKHYTRAIEECMAKIEDAYERNPKSTALPKALTTLGDATGRHLEALRSMAGKVTDDDELRALGDAIEQAELANKGAREGLKQK